MATIDMSVSCVGETESSMARSATLDAMPAEILLEIFGWVCRDEIDLRMLSVSKSVRTILLVHPVVRALGAFSMHRSEKGIQVVSNNKESQHRPDSNTTKLTPLCPATTCTINEVAHQPWFRNLDMSQLQAAVTRRLIRVYWTPYLRRDGRIQKPSRLDELTQQITSLWWQAYDQARQGDMCILPDAVVEYPWTHLQMWPLDGRVIIRDQLSNTWEELDVPIVRLVGEWKGREEEETAKGSSVLTGSLSA